MILHWAQQTAGPALEESGFWWGKYVKCLLVGSNECLGRRSGEGGRETVRGCWLVSLGA